MNLIKHKNALAAGVLIAVAAIAGWEYRVVRPAQAEQEALRADLATLDAKNSELERLLRSAEEQEAWMARVRKTNEEWTAFLEKLPSADRVEDTYTDLKAIVRASGVNLLDFERKTVTLVGGSKPTPTDATTIVAPGVERRQIKIRYTATLGTHERFLAAMAAYTRPINIEEFNAKSVVEGPYTMEVTMLLDVYFRRRADAVMGEHA